MILELFCIISNNKRDHSVLEGVEDDKKEILNHEEKENPGKSVGIRRDFNSNFLFRFNYIRDFDNNCRHPEEFD